MRERRFGVSARAVATDVSHAHHFGESPLRGQAPEHQHPRTPLNVRVLLPNKRGCRPHAKLSPRPHDLGLVRTSPVAHPNSLLPGQGRMEPAESQRERCSSGCDPPLDLASRSLHQTVDESRRRRWRERQKPYLVEWPDPHSHSHALALRHGHAFDSKQRRVISQATREMSSSANQDLESLLLDSLPLCFTAPGPTRGWKYKC